MNDIQIFNNPEFGEIRTVMIDKNLCFSYAGYAEGRWK